MKAIRLLFLATLLYFVVATPAPDADEVKDVAEKPAKDAPEAPAKAADDKEKYEGDDKPKDDKPKDEEKPKDEKPKDEEKPKEEEPTGKKPAGAGATCGGDKGILCEHGLVCKAEFVKRESVFKCAPATVVVPPGELEGPCKGNYKAADACKAGLSCVPQKDGIGAIRFTCLKAGDEEMPCTEDGSQPCAAGYICAFYKMAGPGVGKCHAKDIPRISKEGEGCEGKSASICGPGMECAGGKGHIRGKVCKAKIVEAEGDSDKPKYKEKCKPPFGKPGSCCDGFLCMPKEPYTKDKMPEEGYCDRYPLQGELCRDGHELERPCAPDYECMSLGPAHGKEKACFKKGSKCVAADGRVCGGKTPFVCGPNMDCVDSKLKYPGAKMCIRKGQKEAELMNPGGAFGGPGGLGGPVGGPAMGGPVGFGGMGGDDGQKKATTATGAVGAFKRKPAAK